MRKDGNPKINPRLTLQAVSPRRSSAALRVYDDSKGTSLFDVLYEAGAYDCSNADDDDTEKQSQLRLPNVDGDDENENVKPHSKDRGGCDSESGAIDI